jgi:hypothetical protein
MIFLNWTWGAVALTGISATLLFTMASLLKTRYRRRRVVTLMFWRDNPAAESRRVFWRRLSQFLTLALLLILAWALSLALGLPVLPIGDKTRLQVMIVDPSQDRLGDNIASVNAFADRNPLSTAVIVAGERPLIMKTPGKLRRPEVYLELAGNNGESLFEAMRMAELITGQEPVEISVFTNRALSSGLTELDAVIRSPEETEPFRRKAADDQSVADIRLEVSGELSAPAAYTLEQIPGVIVTSDGGVDVMLVATGGSRKVMPLVEISSSPPDAFTRVLLRSGDEILATWDESRSSAWVGSRCFDPASEIFKDGQGLEALARAIRTAAGRDMFRPSSGAAALEAPESGFMIPRQSRVMGTRADVFSLELYLWITVFMAFAIYSVIAVRNGSC